MNTYRETIAQSDAPHTALDLCIMIQNAGIANVMFDFSGHVNSATIWLHAPIWFHGRDPKEMVYIYGSGEMSEKGSLAVYNDKAISRLRVILDTWKLLLRS